MAKAGSTEKVVREIRRHTRRRFSAEVSYRILSSHSYHVSDCQWDIRLDHLGLSPPAVASRYADAHETLDAAVAAAYGSSADISDDAVLRELLALNGAGRADG